MLNLIQQHKHFKQKIKVLTYDYKTHTVVTNESTDVVQKEKKSKN